MRFSGSQLYDLRLQRNMSRADLAFAIRSISAGQIRATERGVRGWEKDENVPRGEALPAIAAALDCEMLELYEGARTSSGAEADDDEDRAARVRRLRAELVLAGRDDLAADLAVLAKSIDPRPLATVADV